MVNISKLLLLSKCLLKHKGLYLVMGIFFYVLSWTQLNEPGKSCIPCRIGDPVQTKNVRTEHLHVHMHIYLINIKSNNISVMCSLSLLHIKIKALISNITLICAVLFSKISTLTLFVGLLHNQGSLTLTLSTGQTWALIFLTILIVIKNIHH